MALAERIMKRAVRICPALVPEGAGIEALRVVRHQVGLRPVRIGGARVESQVLGDGEGEEKLRVVHCYGAGGFGYQSSYGMANRAVVLVEEVLGLEG
jgi:D-amino-acid oxidase